MKQLKENTINFVINLLDREIMEEERYLEENNSEKDYLKDLIETKADFLRATSKTTWDLLIAKEIIEQDLKLLKD